MDPKNKTLIPLIIIFFILGVAVGYVAHKPETIEKIVTVTVTPIPTPPPTPTGPIPTPTTTPTATETPLISDFTVRNYDPFKDTPTYTIKLRNYAADPSTLSIRQGETVLIQIADVTLITRMTLILNETYKQSLGTAGAVIVVFNKKGIYTLEANLPRDDPTIIPLPYAKGTITVY